MPTPPGLYRWPDNLQAMFEVDVNHTYFQCPVAQWGEIAYQTNCPSAQGIPSASINPSDAKDFVGIAPTTPMHLTYPSDGELVEDYLFLADFDPQPDWVAVTAMANEGDPAQYYATACKPIESLGGPPEGGCDGWMPPDYVKSGAAGGLGWGYDPVGKWVVPPAGMEYDSTPDGQHLFPASQIGNAVVEFAYETADGIAGGAVGSVSIIYSMMVRLYWELEDPPDPPPSGGFMCIL